MEQEILKMLSSGKSLDRHKRVLHLLNSKDSGECEEENQPPKEAIPWLGLHQKKLICAYYSIKGGKCKWLLCVKLKIVRIA